MAEAALALSLSSFLAFSFAGRERRALHQLGRYSIGLSGLALLALLVYRSIQISFPALTGTYEGMVFLTAALALFVFIAEDRLLRSNKVLLAAGSFTAFLFLVLLVSPLVSAEVHPPVPILRSYWLVLHVAFSFVGIALFTFGMVAAVVGFFQAKPRSADRARDGAIAVGFVFYVTGGLVFGAIWAEAAWGRFWGWDPKETWALITTLFYTGYLHLRYLGKVRPHVTRVLAILCWALAIFTFWGVNALLPGLHSYA